MGRQREKQTTFCYDLKMAGSYCEISTESEDAEDFAEDSTAGKLLPSDVTNGSSDSGSDRDDESELGKVPFRRRRVEWETVETWDCEVLEDGHIRDCILNNVK
jgi:hypothetical protein